MEKMETKNETQKEKEEKQEARNNAIGPLILKYEREGKAIRQKWEEKYEAKMEELRQKRREIDGELSDLAQERDEVARKEQDKLWEEYHVLEAAIEKAIYGIRRF
jgi:hypothetical protein